MQKNGFTLVELAIVLVVIGLIMGMAIKGKALIEVARMRAEVAKITQIEVASHIYATKTQKIAKSNNDLIDNGLITEKSFISKYVAGGRYELLGCSKYYKSEPAFVHISSVKLDSSCMKSFFSFKIDKLLACNIENLIDDQSYFTGIAKRFLSYASSNSWSIGSTWRMSDDMSVIFSDCDKLTGEAEYMFVF